jgi:hypothetical protein
VPPEAVQPSRQEPPARSGEVDRESLPEAVLYETSAADEVDAATVETDIGPLPADLWRLIGQDVPQQPEEKPISPKPESQPRVSVQRQPEKPSPPQAGRLESRQVISTITPGHISPQDLPDVVQMAARDEQVETRSADRLTRREASGDGSGVDEAGGEDSGGEIDVDELSRKVYQEIKRRLVGEWERMRRRF